MQMAKNQEDVLNYWRSLCLKAPDTLPARADILPQDLGRHMSSLIIMDVLGNPLDFRYRLVGTYVRDFLYADYTGKSFLELKGKGPDSRIWEIYNRARQINRPLFCDVPYVGPKADFMRSATLYLPLASDHKTVDKIMAVNHFESRVDAKTREIKEDEHFILEL